MPDTTSSKENTLHDPLFRWFLGLAAVILLGFVAKETLHFSNAPSANTKVGEVKKEVLPGGSRVWLNSNTHFSYGTPWLMDVDRDVWINGEGFFDLKRWGNNRYVVHTPFADIISFDGKFNVTNRDNKVCVYNTADTLVLRPGPENKFREFFMLKGDYYEFDKGLVIKKTNLAEVNFNWFDSTAVIK